MSYLSLANGVPSFTKAVISFWFRIPQTSLDAAEADDLDHPLAGIIPLMVIGKVGVGHKPYTTTYSQALFSVATETHAEGLGNTSEHVVLATDTWTLGGTTVVYDSLVQDVLTYNPGASFVTTSQDIYADVGTTAPTGEAVPSDPTFIGVRSGYNVLCINFETFVAPGVSDYDFEVRSFTPGSSDGPGETGYSGPVPSLPGPCDSHPTGTESVTTSYSSPIDFVGTVVDETHAGSWVQYPVCPTVVHPPVNNWTDITGIVLNKSGVIQVSPSVDVTPDHWHHILISVDLSEIASHGTASKEDEIYPIGPYLDRWSRLFLAFDDKNYDGYDLGGVWDESVSDKNAVFTQEAFTVAGAIRKYDGPDDTPVGGVAHYSLDPKIPAGTIGIPAHSEFVKNIFQVEMAEFQMWTGVTLDTGIEANRRAFVDEDGVPVSPERRPPSDDHPAGQPAPADVLLGKRPDILLHGSGNWKDGTNTGSTGIRLDGEGNPIMIPAGQFTPTGTIDSYKPDPSLHGTQSRTDPVRLTKKVNAGL